MGIHFSELTPLGELSQEQTREAAIALLKAATDRSRPTKEPLIIAQDEIEQVFASYKPFRDQNVVQYLKSARWIQEISAGRYRPRDHLIDIATAIKAPRMTFAEACDQIRSLRQRLDAAPHEIDGIRLNHVFLYGSAARDPASGDRESIGDLDLMADFSFIPQYINMSKSDKRDKIKSAWIDIIGNGDERLAFNVANDYAPIIVSLLERQGRGRNSLDPPDKPFVILRIWSRLGNNPSNLSEREWVALETLESRTLSTQIRARIIAEIVGSCSIQASFTYRNQGDYSKAPMVPCPALPMVPHSSSELG